jgi:hypothetical protein
MFPIPIELVERILLLLWSSVLSTTERQQLFCHLSVTSRIIGACFARVVSTDLHIFGTTHAAHVVRAIVNKSSGNDGVQRVELDLCRALTFVINDDLTAAEKARSAAALQALLYLAHTVHCFPRLGAVSLVLPALRAGEVQTYIPTLLLPPTVYTLSVTLAPTPEPSPPSMLLRRTSQPGRLGPPPTHDYTRGGFSGWATSQVRVLTLCAPAAFADDLARACPRLRTLRLAWPGAQARWWETLVPLRVGVRALILDIGKLDPKIREGLERLAAVVLTSRVFVDWAGGALIVEVDGEESGCLPVGWETACHGARAHGINLSVRRR